MSDEPVLTLVDFETPDPFVISAHGRYYMTFTCGDRVDILAADSLARFRSHARRRTVWIPPPEKHFSAGLWAPELHALDGQWYIYVACEDPKHGNRSHRMYVLGGPPAEADPMAGPWLFLGPIQGMPQDQWAIDGTVLSLRGHLYFAYSGWPVGERSSDLIQELFIMRLSTPTQADSAPVRICKPEQPWEFSHDANGAHGINEGPQFLCQPGGSWVGLAYSCAGSWTSEYKMNVLALRGQDPLEPSSWQKGTTPLVQKAPAQALGPWGPGHGNFVNLGQETLAVFHATDEPGDGWKNRKARAQRLYWTDGGPSMGLWLGTLVTDINTFTKFRPPSAPPTTAPEDHHFHALFTGPAKD